MDGNDLLRFCVAGSCSWTCGRVSVLSWQASNGALFIPVTKRMSNMSVCVCVCDRGRWLDIHVALIIVPLLLGSHSGVGQALMLGWSHVTLDVGAEVAYWCRHHIVTYISYQEMAVWNESLHVCVCVCLSCSVAVWMGERCVCERSCWFPGNERDVLECKYKCKYELQARKRKDLLDLWNDDTKERVEKEIERERGKCQSGRVDGWVDTLSSTLNNLRFSSQLCKWIFCCEAVLMCVFEDLIQSCAVISQRKNTRAWKKSTRTELHPHEKLQITTMHRIVFLPHKSILLSWQSTRYDITDGWAASLQCVPWSRN